MPETTAVSEAVSAETTGTEAFLEQLIQQEWFPYAAAAAVILLLIYVFVKYSHQPAEKCPCCESGGQVIGGVRTSDTDVWIKEAKYCPLCGRQLKQ